MGVGGEWKHCDSGSSPCATKRSAYSLAIGRQCLVLVESVSRGGVAGSERDARMKDAEVDVALLKSLQVLWVQYSRAASNCGIASKH